MRLGGAARELVRNITPDELQTGGVVDGVLLDPVTHIVASLQRRFAMLDDESRLAATTQLLTFQRRPSATMNGTQLCANEPHEKVILPYAGRAVNSDCWEPATYHLNT